MHIDRNEEAYDDEETFEGFADEQEQDIGNDVDDAGSDDEDEPDAAGAQGSDFIGFDDEQENPDGESDEKDWVKNLRAINRRLAKEAAARRADAVPAAPVALEPLPPKPDIADYAYDQDAWQADLDKWEANKLAHEEQASIARQAEEARRTAWAKELEGYADKKRKLARPDFEEAESIVVDMLTPEQQALIVKAGRHIDSAAMIYALGKSPRKLEEIAVVTDPVDFVFKVAEMSKSLKVGGKRKAAANIDEPVSGGAPIAGKNSTLARLEREAERTGNRTELIRYRKKMRERERR